MVVVEEPPLILFPGLTWGHFAKEVFRTKSCTVDDDSSTSDSNSNSDSNITTNSDLGSSLTSCSPDSLSSEPNHPMTSSLGYKRNAKHTETNVIGDGFPLTNFCVEQWCQQIIVPGIFLFRCIFLGQCTLKLSSLSLRHARGTPAARRKHSLKGGPRPHVAWEQKTTPTRAKGG